MTGTSSKVHKESNREMKEGDVTSANLSVIVNTNFRSPSVREIHELSRYIQKFENEKVKEIIWRNPKILVTEVDTPILMHEGCRYNALHICAKHGNAEAAKLILQAISSTKMTNMLYPHDNEDNKCIRVNYLVDLYLNTPDATIHETPLHFATKFGHPTVCEVLMQHPKVQLDVLNKDEETPMSVICRRVSDSDPTKDERFNKINRLFLAVFIVPIWRETDGSNGLIGKPVMPKQLGPEFCPQSLLQYFQDIDSRLFDAVDPSLVPIGLDGAPMRITAYIGPMTAKEANAFLNLMKKSSRSASFFMAHSLSCTMPLQACAECNRCFIPKLEPIDIQKCESAIQVLRNQFEAIEDKGKEKEKLDPEAANANTAAAMDELLCKNHLDKIVTSLEKIVLEEESKGNKATKDLQSSLDVLKGAKLYSRFPKPRPQSISSIRESATRMEDPLTGLERVARLKAKEIGLPMKQQWNFLETFVDVTTDEGLQAVEDHLREMEQDDLEVIGALKLEYNGDESSLHELCEKIFNLKIVDDSPQKGNTSRRNSAGQSSNGSTEDCFEDCLTKEVFVHGDNVTMDDWFLQKAIQDTLEAIPETERNSKYPTLNRWYNKLKSFGYPSRRGWAAAKPQRRR